MSISRTWTTSAMACNAIFTIGGRTNNMIDLWETEAYDPGTNTWRLRANMPIRRFGHSSGVVNNKIYVFGGFDNAMMNYEYNPTTDTWMVKAPMPNGRAQMASIVLNNKIFAIGGKLENGVTSEVDIYDPVTDSWTSCPSMPTPRAAACAAVVAGKIYVIGGYNDANEYLNKNEVYDTVTMIWTTAPSMPTRRGCHVGAAIGPFIYMISGCDETTYLTVNEVYDTQYNSWQTKAEIPRPCKGAGVAVLNDKIYVMAGSNITILDVCQEYTPDNGSVEEQAASSFADPGVTAMMTGRQLVLSCRRGVGTQGRFSLLDATGRQIAEWDRVIGRTMRLRTGVPFAKGIYFLRLQNRDFYVVVKAVCVN